MSHWVLHCSYIDGMTHMLNPGTFGFDAGGVVTAHWTYFALPSSTLISQTMIITVSVADPVQGVSIGSTYL
jgi:hypothetical protein